MPQSNAELQTYINDGRTKSMHCVPLSPIFQTPELLRVIFLYCLSSSAWPLNASCHRNHPEPSGREAPLRLAHVCQHWRAIALDTSQLWDLGSRPTKVLPRMSAKMCICGQENWMRFVPFSAPPRPLLRDTFANFGVRAASNTLTERQLLAPVKTVLDNLNICTVLTLSTPT